MADVRHKTDKDPEEHHQNQPQQQQQQHTALSSNEDQQQQSQHDQTSNLGSRNKGKNKLDLVKKTRKIPTVATVGASPFPPPCTIILEEGKDVPVFWDGENPKPLIKWSPFLDKEGNKQQQIPQFFSTIQEFLSFYAAGKYLNKCSMSLQATSTKYITNLKLSDPFSKIIDHHSEDGRPVTLSLTHANVEDSEGGYSKFTLYIRELQGRKVLWNGSIPTNRLVAKLNQSDMSLTIENCLQNYVAKGYLSQNCQVDLVKERSDTIPSNREELSTISTFDLVNTLFKGNSASIVIRKTNSNSKCDDNEARQQLSGRDLQDMSSESSMKIPVFTSPPGESNWVGKTWGEISENVRELINSVDITMRDMVLPLDAYASVLEKKRLLETAIRRRSRVVDEVWRCFLSLRTVRNDLLNGNFTQSQRQNSRASFQSAQNSSQILVGARTGGDLDNALQVHQSCLDFLSSSLIRYGLELELYDEESQSLSRIAGVGVGIAVAIAICTIVYYY